MERKNPQLPLSKEAQPSIMHQEHLRILQKTRKDLEKRRKDAE